MCKFSVLVGLSVVAVFASLASAAVEFEYPIDTRSPAENGGTMSASMTSDLAMAMTPFASMPSRKEASDVSDDGESGFDGAGNAGGGSSESAASGEDPGEDAGEATSAAAQGSRQVSVNPEPASLIVWSALAAFVMAGFYRRRRTSR